MKYARGRGKNVTIALPFGQQTFRALVESGVASFAGMVKWYNTVIMKKLWVVIALILSVPPAARACALLSQGAQKEITPQQQFQVAVSHYQSGQYALAARELENLARQMAPTFEVQELLGLVYSAEKKDLEANRALQEAVRLSPDSAAARGNLAINLARLGKNREAEAEFKQAVHAAPDNFETNHIFGEFYAHEGRLDEAIIYLAKAQSLQPTSYDNGYDLSLAYEKAKRFKEARQQILELLRVKRTAELYSLLADVDERSGNYLAAAKEYQQAVYLMPSEQNIFNWGSEFLLHNTWEPAIEIFSKGLQRYPNSAPLAIGLGMTLYWQGKYVDAVKALVRATDLAPSDPNTYYFLGEAYERVPSDVGPEETDEVIARFRHFEELQPRNPRAAYYYAMSRWTGKKRQGRTADPAQVESLLKKAIQLDPSFPKAHFQLGNVYSDKRQYTDAISEYQQAIKLDPNVADVYYRLGQAYFHLGERDLAQKEFTLHQKLLTHHQAEDDRQRNRTFQFIYSTREHPAVHHSQ